MNVRAGFKYRTIADLRVICMTHWKRPFTGGYMVVLPAGESMVVTADPPPSARGANCRPERYDDLLLKFIPEDERNDDSFGGYSLSVPFEDLSQKCVRVD